MRPTSMPSACQTLAAQSGQALSEAILALPLLVGLWWAIGWTGELQQSGMQAGNDSRLLAFRAAAQANPLAPDRTPELLARPASRSRSQPARGSDRLERLRGNFEPGAGSGQFYARVLREQWLADERGLLRASVQRTAVAPRGLHQPDSAARPVLWRHTVLATGAAHSSSDTQAQARIGLSQAGWRGAAQLSSNAGESVAAVMQRVDRPWRRPALDLDWLTRWQSVVPNRYLNRR